MATKSARTGGLRRFLIAVVAVSVLGVTALSLAMSGGRRAAVTVDPRIPVGAARGYLLGRADAPVQVMEFGDFECPACGGFATLTEPDVRARLINTGIVAFRFFDFLIPDHQNSFTAHLAAACAGEQSMFWEMHDRLYANQDEWSNLRDELPNPLKKFRRYATELGLDVNSWDACVATQKVAARIKGNQAEGERRNVQSTPTFIIGDKQVGLVTYDEFKHLVDDAMTKRSTGAIDSPVKPRR